MTLPADLVRAVQDGMGGKVAFVTGAGCSMPAPTSLQSGSQYSRTAYALLLDAGVLTAGDCADPADLSMVADSVFKSTDHQAELVERLPVDLFRFAEPNEGHLIAAALLREKVLSNIITLNFDLAFSNAVSAVGGGTDVSVVFDPSDHTRLGLTNVIYLHRSALAAPDDWVLRTEVLEKAWEDGWEEVMTQRILSGPVTVFAGLGSPAAVLFATTKHIRKVLDNVRVYQVDPVPRDESHFFEALDLPGDAYIQMGWVEFMKDIGRLVANRHLLELVEGCARRASEEGWEGDEESLRKLLASVNGALLTLGIIRARCLLSESHYVPRTAPEVALVADLLLAASYIARVRGVEPSFGRDGALVLNYPTGGRTVVALASGKGVLRWATMDARVAEYLNAAPYHERPSLVVVSGISGGARDLSPPIAITGGEAEASIARPIERVRIVDIDELRANPDLMEELLGGA